MAQKVDLQILLVAVLGNFTKELKATVAYYVSQIFSKLTLQSAELWFPHCPIPTNESKVRMSNISSCGMEVIS